MLTKLNPTSAGLNLGVDEIARLINTNVAASGTLLVGTPLLRDVTQLPGGLLPADRPPSRLFFNARVFDSGVLATSANGGDVLGVFQGVNNTSKNFVNSGTVSTTYTAYCRANGLGRVLAGAVAAGTAVTIGSTLVVTNANVFATVGTRAIGTSIGRVTAYAINTSVAAAIPAGSQTVTPVSMIGITTSTPLTIDLGPTQEIVTPSAITATTFTATFTYAHSAGVYVQGINAVQGATIIPVPGAGSTSAVVYADISGIL